MQVTVVGQQWWWEYQYDVDGDGETDITTANDLVIPAGRNIDLDIESRDVLHSFWIPRLHGHLTAVTGRSTPLQLSAYEPRLYHALTTPFFVLSPGYLRLTL